MSDILDIQCGQETTIFDRFDLSFEVRAKLIRLCNRAFDLENTSKITKEILFFVDGELEKFAQVSKKAQHIALEAIDYILALCRNKRNKPIIPALSRKLSGRQRKIGGGSINTDPESME